MPAEPVTLVVGANAYSNWTRYEVQQDFYTPADAWSVELGDPAASQVRAVEEGQSVILMVGTQIVLRGQVETVSLRSSRGGDVLQLAGRDQAAPLVDCSVPPERSLRGLSLTALATKACTELGVLMAVVSTEAAAAQVLPHIQVETGETWWEVLDREARRLELVPWVAPDGLHLGKPDTTSAPVAELRRIVSGPERETTNVLEANVVWQTANRRSPVYVCGQADASDDDTRITGKATDPVLTAAGLSRPLVIWDAGCTSSKAAKLRAAREITERAAAGLELQYTVPGHADASGAPWRPNTCVAVRDERAGITGIYWLASVAFSRDRGGTRSQLTLKPPYNTLASA